MNPALNPAVPQGSDGQLPMATKATVPGMVLVDTKTKSIKKAYFVRSFHTSTYIFANGNKAAFIFGLVPGVNYPAFVTDIVGYQKEMDEQANKFGSVAEAELSDLNGFFTIAEFETVSNEQLDPLSAVKNKAVADFLASDEFKKEVLRAKGIGTPADSKYDKPELKPASSATLNEGASASNAGMNASVAALTSPK